MNTEKEMMNEYEDEEARIFELEDDEGNVEKFLHVATIDYKGAWYCCFQKAEPESEEEEDDKSVDILFFLSLLCKKG